MASSKLRPAASSSGDPLPDAMYEILLRQPAKELCRLRVVCLSWRALTYCPLFIAAHKARHTDPLLAVGYSKGRGIRAIRFGVVDLSGKALGQIPTVGGGIVPVRKTEGQAVRVPASVEEEIHVLRIRVDLICFARFCRPLGLWILNPITGATLALPECRSEELVRELKGAKCSQVESRAVGQVSSTGVYKALRITGLGDEPGIGRQLCEVITFDGIGHGRWRGKQDPPSLVQTNCVVVGSVVYFLIKFYSMDFTPLVSIAEPSSIAPFNLETEEWMGILREVRHQYASLLRKELSYPGHSLRLSLAELNGCLVTAHNIHGISMDLWFMTDVEEGGNYGKRTVESYNPRTGTHADVLEALDSDAIGTYAGSLLSL